MVEIRNRSRHAAAIQPATRASLGFGGWVMVVLVAAVAAIVAVLVAMQMIAPERSARPSMPRALPDTHRPVDPPRVVRPDNRASPDSVRPGPSGPPTIRIGVVLPVSGELGGYGQEVWNGLELAIPEGRRRLAHAQLELVLLDNEGDPFVSITRVEEAINEHAVVGLIGALTSGNTLAVSELTDPLGLPVLTPSATAVDVVARREFVSRSCYNDSDQGRAAAAAALDLLDERNVQTRTAAIVVDETQAYSVGLAREFATAFANGGGEVVLRATIGNVERDGVAGVVAEVTEADPAVIFAPLYYPEAAALMRDGHAAWGDTPVVGGDGWDSPTLLALLGEEVLQTIDAYMITHFVADRTEPHVQDFVSRYEQMFDGRTPGAMAALGHDAGLVLLDALERASTATRPIPTGDRLHNAIRRTTIDGVTGRIVLRPDGNADTHPSIARLHPDGFEPWPR